MFRWVKAQNPFFGAEGGDEGQRGWNKTVFFSNLFKPTAVHKESGNERERERDFQSSSAGISLSPFVQTPSHSLFCRINAKLYTLLGSTSHVHTYTHTYTSTRAGTYRRRRIDPTAAPGTIAHLHVRSTYVKERCTITYLRVSVCVCCMAVCWRNIANSRVYDCESLCGFTCTR